MTRVGAASLGAVACLAQALPARAQPLDPYADPIAEVDAEPPIAVGVAGALVARAELLLDGGDTASAQQLAREALALLTTGHPSEADLQRRAQGVLSFGAGPDPAMVPFDPPEVDVEEPPPIVDKPPLDRPEPTGRRALMGYGAAAGGALGGILGVSAADGVDGSGAGWLPGTAVGAGLGAGLGYGLGGRLPDGRARLMGSGALWGVIATAAFADVVSGLDSSTSSDISWGATLGGLAGLGAGYGFSRGRTFTAGDVAMMDAFAGLGGLAGLTLGVALDPVEGEGYSLNLALGVAGGWAIGAMAAPKLAGDPRRALYVTGFGLLGAAAPWLLYPAIASDEIDGSNDGQQAIGFFSAVGLVGGVALGLHRTRGRYVEGSSTMAAGAPATALLTRSADGRWDLGAIVPHLDRTPEGGSRATLSLAAGSF